MTLEHHTPDVASDHGHPKSTSTSGDLFEGARSEIVNLRRQLADCIASLNEELTELQRSVDDLATIGDAESCERARSQVRAYQKRNSNTKRDARPKTESDAVNTRFGMNHPLFPQARQVIRSLLLQGRRPLSAGAIKAHLNTRGGIPEFQVESKSIGNRLIKMGMRRVVSETTGENLWWPAGTDIPAGYR